MEKEYLGLSLSLSLSFPSNGSPAHLSLLQCSPPSQPSYSFCQQNQSQWHSLLHTHSHSAAGRRKSEENEGASSPNSSASTASAKTAGRDGEERASLSDDEDGGDGCRKKLRLSKDQSAVLEGSFKEHSTLNLKQKLALAKQLNLRPRQVEVWFQNRRARTKLKQTEVDCELLRRCCHDLSEENRRLQKEVHELRALKLSPQLYMHMTPPTTLTLCPSCERLTTSTPSSRNRPFPEHHHRRPVAAPSAPIPLRPSFLDAPPQRS